MNKKGQPKISCDRKILKIPRISPKFAENTHLYPYSLPLNHVIKAMCLINYFQPLDQGVIHSFKAHYRKNLIALMISKLEKGEDFLPNDVNLLKAMEMIVSALDSVSAQTIRNCFIKAKFNIHSSATEITFSEEPSDDWEEIWSQLKDKSSVGFDTYQNYVLVDNNERTSKQIIEEIQNKDVVHTIESDASDPEEIPNVLVSSSEAFNYIYQVFIYSLLRIRSIISTIH